MLFLPQKARGAQRLFFQAVQLGIAEESNSQLRIARIAWETRGKFHRFLVYVNVYRFAANVYGPSASGGLNTDRRVVYFDGIMMGDCQQGD